MNKFRARQLDASKPIAIFIEGETPQISEINNATNRTVPQLPTGMEKDEETEHHLQQAIFHQRVIPVPEVFDTTQNECLLEHYDKMYPPNFKLSRSMIHIHPFEIDHDIPDYDIDSGDEAWLDDQKTRAGLIPIAPSQFEEMMDQLEKASGLGAVTLQEAKLLLKDDDDLITAVYDHWLNKRLCLQHPLIPQVVKAEKGIGSAPTDPYVAFRKRTEKMQTRKNRKNDEVSYEKMLKLRRDLCRVTKVLDMMSLREKQKTELIRLTLAIYEKRYKLEDFCGSLIKEMVSVRTPTTSHSAVHNHELSGLDPDVDSQVWRKLTTVSTKNKRKNDNKERRPYRKKRKLATSSISSPSLQFNNLSDPYSGLFSQEGHSSVGVSEDELLSHSEGEDDSNLDGPWAFRRKANVTYLAPKDPFPRDADGLSSEYFGSVLSPKQYCITNLSKPVNTCIGLARRRVGRGGRVWLDRINMPKLKGTQAEDFLYDTKKWPIFHPISPLGSSENEDHAEVDVISSPLAKPLEGPSAFYISAEVTEGRYAGSCSQLEVVAPAGLGPSETVLESNGLLGPHSSSRFCIWNGSSAGSPQIVLKTVSGPSDELLSSSCVNNSYSSSFCGSSAPIKMAATSSCTLSPSSPAPPPSATRATPVKNNSLSADPTCKKSNHCPPLYIHHRQHKDGPPTDGPPAVQMCNKNVIFSNSNSDATPPPPGGLVSSKVLTSWNSESIVRDEPAPPLITNGPTKSKRPKASAAPAVFSETENL